MLDIFGGVQTGVYYALLIAAFAVKLVAFVDCVRRPTEAFTYAAKRSKNLWLAITGIALAVTIVDLNPLGLLGIIGSVAAIVYLVDVKPAVSQYRAGGSSSSGPYGPW